MSTPSAQLLRARSGMFGLLFLLLSTDALHAFFVEPNPLEIEVGTTGEVTVRGSSADASVSLQSISIAPSNGGITHDLTGTRDGTGSVKVKFTGHAPGVYFVTFSGKDNGDNVQGFTSIIVPPPPGTSAQNIQFAIAGDPINTRSGEYFGIEAVDLNLGGPMPLSFSRYVASGLSADNLVRAALGANRSHNFAARMVSQGSDVRRVILPTGRMLRFDKSGKKWVLKSPLDVPFQFVESGGSFLLGHPHTKQIWTFDSNGRLTKIEDGKGNAHTLTYTAGKLSTVNDGLGRVIEIAQPSDTIDTVAGVTGAERREVNFTYASGVLTEAADYGSDLTLYTNADGLPTGIIRPAGNALFTQTYTGGKVTSQTERGTDTSTLTYGVNSTTFTDPTGNTLVDHYSAAGNLTSHVDEAGKAITMSYDTVGRRSAVTDRMGRVITTQHHAPSGLPAAITNAEGKRTLFAYKARTLSGITFHDLVKITWPDGSARSFVHDAKGNLTQLTDETGKAWKFTYNNRGQILTATNPLGGVTNNTYDDAGNLATTTPPDESGTTFAYDARHRLTQITRPGGATVLLSYDGKDRITSITDERGKVFTYAYDSNNRLTGVTDPDTNTTTFAHDVLDRVTSVTDRLGESASVTYTPLRQLSTRTDRNGNTTALHYDARQRPVEIIDPGGQTWSFGYDDEGRLTSMQNPVDAPSQRRLNLLGFPIEFSDPLGHTTTLARDAMQRITQHFDPLGRQTAYTYDKRGRLLSATEQGTGAVKITRDALGNITKFTDPNGGAWSFAYLKSGRVQKATDPLGKSISYEYDNRGRIESVSFPDTTGCTIAFDAANNITGMTFGNGPVLAFARDNLGRIASTNDLTFSYDAEGRITNGLQNGQEFLATYDDGGRLETVAYLGGALTVTYSYDSRDRLATVTDSKGTSIAFTYDNAGRLTGQTRTPGIASTYTYDAAGRLTRIVEGPHIDLQYTLNAASEILSVDYMAPAPPIAVPSSENYTFGKAGEITTAGFAYDARGRLTNAPGGRTFQWDGASRLIAADGATLTYNGLSDIVTRTDNIGNTTRFYHHYAIRRAPIVYEDLPGPADRAYVWTPGGTLLYSVDILSGDPTFYHFDRMGSTIALTNKSGAVTASYAYGPYGETLARNGGSTQPFTYIGAFGVREEGGGALYQMRARYYDPATARFLSRDPLPPRLADPESANRYAYAAQNPMKYIDPNGHKESTPGGDGVRIAGNGRFGLVFDDGFPDPVVNARLRFDLDTSLETDSGIAFSGRIRVNCDESGTATPYPSSDYIGKPVPLDSNLLLTGVPSAGHSPASSFVTKCQQPTFAGFSTKGLGLYSYTSGGLSFLVGAFSQPGAASAPANSASCEPSAASLYCEINPNLPNNLCLATPYPTLAKPLSITFAGFSVADQPAEPDISTVGSGFTYDLGGATIGSTIANSFGTNSVATFGIRFSY